MSLIRKIINKNSIRPQLFFAVATGIVALLFFTIYASNWVSHQQVRQVLIKQGLQISSNLAQNSRLALLYESPDNATRAVKETLAFPDVVSVTILNLDNTILYQSEYKHDQTLPFEIINKATNSTPKLIFENAKIWQFFAPVLTTSDNEYLQEQLYKSKNTAKEKLIGYVVVTSSKARLAATREGILYSNLTIASIIGSLLLIVIQITIKRLTQPLYSISKTMQQAEHSEKLEQITISGPLEVRYIADSYNKMVSTLAERDERLRKQNDFLEYQAVHEHLTGLTNRIGFEQGLKLALGECKSLHVEHALCYMDLDKFKIVNDSCGHNAGDELLQNVSEMFKQHIRKDSDTLARVGGDEFALILKNCSIKKASSIGEEICKEIENYRFHWEEKVFSIGVSIGICKLDKDNDSVDDAVSSADKACYIAKERGRGQIYVLQQSDQELESLSGETKIASELIDYLDNNKFDLYCQLIKPLNNVGDVKNQYEILLRMKDEEGNKVLPEKFFVAAERYDLMQRIDRWVVTQTLKQLHESPKFVNQMMSCTINVSASSINDDSFKLFIKEQLEQNTILPEKICFELTETVTSRHMLKAKQFIKSMHDLGCRIGLDDFVSNSSSFSHIKNMQINYLKIQGDFFKDIAKNPVNHAMTRSINEIAHILNIQTVAEHIEDEQSLQEVKNIGIDFAQGYLINKPAPLKDVCRRVDNENEST